MHRAVDVAWQKHPEKAKRRKGGSPTDGARVTPRTDAESEGPPGDARRAVVVSHAESWRQNIYSHKKVIPFCSGIIKIIQVKSAILEVSQV